MASCLTSCKFSRKTFTFLTSEKLKKLLVALFAICVILVIVNDQVQMYWLDQEIKNAGFLHDKLLRNEGGIKTDPEVIHPDCHCAVNLPRPLSDIPSDSDLACSRFAGLRGSHQKIVSFSYYSGKYEDWQSSDYIHRDYFSGLERNLEAIKDLYGPSWTLRLYHEMPRESLTWRNLCKLVCTHNNLDVCDVHRIPNFSKSLWNQFKNSTMLWLTFRFCVIGASNNVEVFCTS